MLGWRLACCTNPVNRRHIWIWISQYSQQWFYHPFITLTQNISPACLAHMGQRWECSGAGGLFNLKSAQQWSVCSSWLSCFNDEMNKTFWMKVATTKDHNHCWLSRYGEWCDGGVAHQVELAPLRLSPDRSVGGLIPARGLWCMSSPLSPVPSCLSHSIIKHQNAMQKSDVTGAVMWQWGEQPVIVYSSHIQWMTHWM